MKYLIEVIISAFVINYKTEISNSYYNQSVSVLKDWPLEPDVMYWENWPIAHPSFLLGAASFNRSDYFDLWKNKKHFFEVEEVKRNVPIRNPLLWL